MLQTASLTAVSVCRPLVVLEEGEGEFEEAVDGWMGLCIIQSHYWFPQGGKEGWEATPVLKQL